MASRDPGGAPVLVRREDGVVKLTLNRPARRNALDPELAGALASAIEAASADPEVRVVVLTGAGSAFCAGAKLDALLAASERGDAEGVGASFRVVEQVYRALLAARPPVIAAVNGPALAGGAGIVGACDFAIGSAAASLGYPEILLGLTPGMVMTLLVRQAGLRVALDLALTGRRVAADEALRLGLLTEVVAVEELDGRVDALARRLAGLSPGAVAATKRWAWTLADAARQMEQGRDLSTLLALSEEARQGMRAFFDRTARGEGRRGEAERSAVVPRSGATVGKLEGSRGRHDEARGEGRG
jgi:methylglutaconyl-CoA hydratase